MTRNILIAVCGALALAAALLGWEMLSSRQALSGAPGWEAVSPEIKVGSASRLEVRLTGAAELPDAGDITVSSTRLDMSPDGMGAMTASVKQVASGKPGVLAFESEITMAGRWQLSLSTAVPGIERPLASSIVFTAIDDTPKPAATDASGKDRKIVYYRNPMGLPDVSPVPKKDSMGMDYIPVYEDEMSGPPGTVQVSMDKIQRSGVRTEKASMRKLGRTVLASGTVTPDEARVWITSAKFSGFVEKLHVAVTGAKVTAGDPLMTVWIENGDLLRKQADYLTALRSKGRNQADDDAIARARRNLETFDFPPEAIEAILRDRAPTRSITMRARAGGTVIEKPAIEGMRFDTGHTHFKIADLSRLWVVAEVAERDLGMIRTGQRATIRFTAYPGEDFEGRVSFIYPDVDMATRTGRVRIELPNPDDRIKIGFYADVRIDAGIAGEPVVTVPETAIIDNGERRVVMVSGGDGRFEPRDVETGFRGQGLVHIRKGLDAGEEIVTSGNFLIDAESNLRAALTAFTAPEPGSPGPEKPGAEVANGTVRER